MLVVYRSNIEDLLEIVENLGEVSLGYIVNSNNLLRKAVKKYHRMTLWYERLIDSYIRYSKSRIRCATADGTHIPKCSYSYLLPGYKCLFDYEKDYCRVKSEHSALFERVEHYLQSKE